MANSLTIEKIDAAYGAVRVLEDVSLDVKSGETVVLLGTNGNGKSTLMKCVMGIVRPRAGRIVVEIDGEKHDLVGRSTEQIVDLGIALVPEGRRLFPRLSVENNLRIGAYIPAARQKFAERLEQVYTLFPRLKERRAQLAGTLSGGEQQMCAIARALMSGPKLVLLDEPSMGLAPVIVAQVFDLVRRLRSEGYTVLIVEQNVRQVLKIADRAYLLEVGRIKASGSSQELLASDEIRKAYMGI